MHSYKYFDAESNLKINHKYETTIRWLREHEEELLATETGEDLDQNEELIHEFEKLMEEFKGIREKFDFVIVYSENNPTPKIKKNLKDLKGRFDTMDVAIKKRDTALKFARILHKFNADAQYILIWIKEKDGMVKDKNQGNDLHSAKKLLKPIQNLEPEISEMENRLKQLKEFYETIKQNYPKQSPKAAETLGIITKNWPEFCKKYNFRYETLEKSVEKFKFYLDVQELEDDLRDLYNQANDDRDGKTPSSYQNSMSDLDVLKNKLHLAKDDILDLSVSVPKHVDAKNLIDPLNKKAKTIEEMLKQQLNKVEVENKLANLKKQISNTKAWADLEKKRADSTNRRTLNLPKDTAEKELRDNESTVETIDAKDEALVLAVGELMASPASADGASVKDEDLVEIELIKEEVRRDLKATKAVKNADSDKLRGVLDYHHYLEDQESLASWIEAKDSAVLALLDDSPSEVDKSLQSLDILEQEVVKRKEKFDTTGEEIEEYLEALNLPNAGRKTPLGLLIAKNKEGLVHLLLFLQNKKDFLLDQDKILKLTQFAADLKDWVNEKSVQIENLAFTPELIPLQSCSKTLDEIDTLLKPQIGKLQNVVSDIENLNVPPEMEEEFTNLLRKYVQLESKHRSKRDGISSWEHALGIRKKLEEIEDWMKDNEHSMLCGYVGSDSNEAERLVNRHETLEEQIENKKYDVEKCLQLCDEIPDSMKKVAIPKLHAFRARWQNFLKLMVSRKSDIKDSVTVHGLVTEGKDLKRTGIEKLQFLLSVGKEQTLDAVQKTKKKIDVINNFNKNLNEFLSAADQKIKGINGDILISDQEMISQFILKSPLTIRDFSDQYSVREIPHGTKLYLNNATLAPFWSMNYSYRGEEHSGMFSPNMIERIPEVEEYRAKPVLDRMLTELRDLYVKLGEILKKTEDLLGKLYNSLLLGKSTEEELEWICNVEKWIKSERPTLQRKTEFDLRVVISLCKDFINEGENRENLLGSIEGEIITSGSNHSTDPELKKVRNILDHLRRRYHDLATLLYQLKMTAEDLLKFFDAGERLHDIRKGIWAVRKIVITLRPSSKGLPQYIIDLIDWINGQHSDHLRIILDIYDGKGVPKALNTEIEDSRDDLKKLNDAIENFHSDSIGLKTADDYIKRANKLNDKIEDLHEDLDSVVEPLKLEVEDVPEDWDPEDAELMIEVAEAELAEVRCEKQVNLDPHMMEFVFDGIELIDKNHPEKLRVKEACENVQDNYENLEKRLKGIKFSIDRSKEKALNGPDEVNIYVKYLSDVLYNPLLQATDQTNEDLKRGSLILDKGESAVEKLREAARRAENQGKPTHIFRDRINQLIEDYGRMRAEMSKKLHNNEFKIAANSFKEWCDQTYEELSDSVDKKHMESLTHSKKVADLNIETRMPEYMAITETGRYLTSNPENEDPEFIHTVVRLLEEVKNSWEKLVELRDFLTQIWEGKKLHRYIKSEVFDIELWITQTQSKIDSDKWGLDVNLIQSNKKSQADFLLQMDANDKKIGYIYEGLEKLSSLNFGISDKLKGRLNNLGTNLADLNNLLEDRQDLLDLWEEVINLIPILAYEKAWIEEQLVRMDIDWLPKSYTDTAFKVKKLGKTKSDMKNRGVSGIPENIPLKLEDVKSEVDEISCLWRELLDKVDKADRLITKYAEFFKWKTACVVFVDQVNQLLSDVDPNIEENSVPSLTSKQKQVNLLVVATKEFGVQYEKIMNDKERLSDNEESVEEEIQMHTIKVTEIFDKLKSQIGDNKGLIDSLLERAKVIRRIEENILYDSTILKKILVIDRCRDLSMASLRLKQIKPLDEKIKASSVTVNKLVEDVEKIEGRDPELLEEVIPLSQPLQRALDYHNQLRNQGQLTLNQIKANQDIYENQLDVMFLQFSNLAGELTRWIEDVEEFCTDGVFSNRLVSGHRV